MENDWNKTTCSVEEKTPGFDRFAYMWTQLVRVAYLLHVSKAAKKDLCDVYESQFDRQCVS